MQVESIAECSNRSILLYLDLCFVNSKTCLKRPLKKNAKIGLHNRLSLNAGQKYCKMLQGEHSAIRSTFIKLPFVSIPLFCLFLSGRFTQVLLYDKMSLCKSFHCIMLCNFELNSTEHLMRATFANHLILSFYCNAFCHFELNSFKLYK